MARKRGRTRNYSTEYRRRVARGLIKGLTKTQARGHRKAAEQAIKPQRVRSLQDAKLQSALRTLRKEKSIAKAAESAGISPERLRAFAIEKGVVEKRGRRFVIKSDITRRLLIYSGGREHSILVSKSRTASLIGRYMAAVRWFLQTNERGHLAPFIGVSVEDDAGTKYLLETRSNHLHRIGASGGSSFEQVYRIIV